MKAVIIYWSGTGNTEAMAYFIAEGAKSSGSEVEIKAVSSAAVEDVSNNDVIILGCPSMGAEVLEESEFEPYMTSIENEISGKKIALFGSYGWGDGEWMRDWAGRIKNAGGILAAESLIVNETPNSDDEENCKEFGKQVTS